MLNKKMFKAVGFIVILFGSSNIYANGNQSVINSDETSRSFSQNDYQNDWALFSNLIQKINMDDMTALSVDESSLDEVQLLKIVRNLKLLTEQLKAIPFKTLEGKQAQSDFILYNDDSIKLLENKSKWEKNDALKRKYIENSERLNQNVMIALSALKELAGS